MAKKQNNHHPQNNKMKKIPNKTKKTKKSLMKTNPSIQLLVNN
jgi:hypothetical protein